ncbi:C13 family peptidase [Stenotrophomonas sp.]|uniref:C13 family peptidase n=1 Tax=Stenotrophomonas sp. TaxID=69392 RepID=UPI0028ABF305|nr:C13 family peptidase [Stenotrophomonas sp.]
MAAQRGPQHSPPRLINAVAKLLLAACAAWPAFAGAAKAPERQATTPKLEGSQLTMLDAALAGLPAQRPGVTDIYVLGVAGDADEDVFPNEVAYLRELSAKRWGAEGRMISLVNQPALGHGGPPQVLATADSIGHALNGLGQTLDPNEDVLFLYLTSHGLHDNSVYLHTGRDQEDYLAPAQLARMLDEAHIGNAVIVVSACFSGAFVPALISPQRMVITAARKDRPSFGCGNTDSATWFGRAFLIEALNATNDFARAYTLAAGNVRRREKEQGERPSEPQFQNGRTVAAVLEQWRAGLPETPAVPYPFVHQRPAGAKTLTPKSKPVANNRKG